MGKRTRIDRLGEKRMNTFGTMMEIVEYNTGHDIYVKFENGGTIKSDYVNFIKGKVKSPYDLSIYGVGYLGEGKYMAYKNNKKTPQYNTWSRMLTRCYSKKSLERLPTYKECFVTEEWHNFQNFAKWYDENYYEIKEERMDLDKDILIKGNKIYSPESCIFTPSRINTLFIKSNATRTNLPIGVHSYFNKYGATFWNGEGKSQYLGLYDDPFKAFNAYKKAKEEYIKEVADNYKDKIPNKLYNAMITYEVEITD